MREPCTKHHYGGSDAAETLCETNFTARIGPCSAVAAA